MSPSLRSAGICVVAYALFCAGAEAATTVSCPEGFTKILDQGGQAVCRRSQSVASADLAESLSRLWWNTAHCNGEENDRQAGISQNQSGAWTVTMRFFCNSF